MAIHAIQKPFQYRMVVGQAKFGMNLLMAIQTGPRITLWIMNEGR